MSRESLLEQLKIERDNADSFEPRNRFPWRWVLVVTLVLVVAAAAGWFFLARPDLTTVHAVEARAVAGGSTVEGSSLLDASGYVVARRQATVSSKITDKVVEITIEEGDHVKEGQILARLDSTNTGAALALAEANSRAAETALDDARPIYLRSRRLLDEKAISQEAFDLAKANYDAAQSSAAINDHALAVARVNEDDTIVRAPFDGVVTVKAAQPGEIVSPISAGGGFTRTGICTIVDMQSLEVDVDVAESFINRVHAAMPAAVTLNAYPDWKIPAEVIAVIPTADRSKATVSVRVRLNAKDPRIVPEMGARVEFLDQSTAPKAAAARQVTVPPEAVQHDEAGGAVVFVLNGGTVERRAVRLGASTREGQIVIAGLTAGDEIATGASGPLSDGMKVTIVNP